MGIIEFSSAVAGILAIIVSLISASSAARRSAFEELKQVVDTLQKSLADEKERRLELEKTLIAETQARIKIEKWARQLVRQLQSANIRPAEMDD